MKLIDGLEERSRAIRQHIIRMTTRAGSGHPGGSLSLVDILVVLYFYKLRHDPTRPDWEDRDRCVLSKGHAAPALYAVLAEAGYFPVKTLDTLRQFGSILQGHPAKRHTPGVEHSGGSLGQGLSVANGIALAAQLDGKKYRVYSLLGDGEIQEGQIWEAAMAARHYGLDNHCAILDNNELQIDGTITEIMNPEPIAEKWKAFGWHVIEIDGHNIKEIIDALEAAERTKSVPTFILAHTVKGKGISFVEGNRGFHGRSLTKEETEKALEELS